MAATDNKGRPTRLYAKRNKEKRDDWPGIGWGVWSLLKTSYRHTQGLYYFGENHFTRGSPTFTVFYCSCQKMGVLIPVIVLLAVIILSASAVAFVPRGPNSEYGRINSFMQLEFIP